MVLKILVLKIIIFMGVLLDPPRNIQLSEDLDWEKLENERTEGYEIDSWSNASVVAACKKEPNSYVILPPIYLAHQELWGDHTLIEQIGDIRNDSFDSIFESKSIPCVKIQNEAKLT